MGGRMGDERSGRRSDPWRSAPGRIRTCDARFRKPTLYPLSYGSRTSTLLAVRVRTQERFHVTIGALAAAGRSVPGLGILSTSSGVLPLMGGSGRLDSAGAPGSLHLRRNLR